MKWDIALNGKHKSNAAESMFSVNTLKMENYDF